MVFVFGLDVPLVEMMFVLTIVLVILLAIMIYQIIELLNLRKDLKKLVKKEEEDIKVLTKVEKAEEKEVKVLNNVQKKMNKIITSDSYVNKVEQLMKCKTTKKKKYSDKDKIKIIADSLWEELVKTAKKKKLK